MKKVEFNSAIISFDNQNILTVTFKDGVEVDIDEIIMLTDASLKIVDNKPFYLLVDARNILSSIDHPSRKYITEHKIYNELNIAQAIVANNMPIRIIANFYIKYYKHINPVKVFSRVEDAKEWLLKQNLNA